MNISRSVAERIGRRVASVVTEELGGGGGSSLTGLPLEGITASVAISPQYLGGTSGQAWADSRHPTVKVEKTYGSGTFQDLYPDPTTGELFTEPNGGGDSATTFADGELLIVETPYNQSLASPVASGHPSVLTDDTRRAILDISTPTLPRFDCFVGTQDASQSATERGYDLGVDFTTGNGFCFISGDCNNPDALDETYRVIQSDDGATVYTQVTQNNRQSRTVPGFVAWLMRPAKVPYVRWIFTGKKTASAKRYVANGCGSIIAATVESSVNSTVHSAHWMGATNSLDGYSYFLVAIEQANIPPLPTMRSIGANLNKLFKGAYGDGEFSLISPDDNEVIPMDLDTETADITIRLMGEPSTEYEAQHVSGGYSSIGTSDATGYLEGTLAGAAKANGTLSVRKVGSAIVNTASTVAVGIVLGKWGQSNMDGRGDNIPTTIPAGSLRIARDVGWSNDTSASKSWLRELAQRLYDDYSCVIATAGFAEGNSYLAKADDGTDGEWNKLNDASTTDSHYNEWVSLMQLVENCNFVFGHQGENDAFDGVSKAQYKTALAALIEGWQEEWRSDLKLYNVSIGSDSLSGNQVDPIRFAQQEMWDEAPSDFPAAGCVAHLEVSTVDNVHFDTVARKRALVDVVERHIFGSGRGPKFSSMSIDGADVDITCTGGVSPLTIDAGEASSPIGWTVTDGAGSRTVNSVSVSGLGITLTCDQALTGTVTVKWLSAATGIGTTLLDSDATTPVPPEPFEESVSA